MRDLERDRVPNLTFVVLCDFLAGASLSDLSREFRLTDTQIEELLRAALYSYGFRATT